MTSHIELQDQSDEIDELTQSPTQLEPHTRPAHIPQSRLIKLLHLLVGFLILFSIITNCYIINHTATFDSSFSSKELTLTASLPALQYVINNINTDPILDISTGNTPIKGVEGYYTVELATWSSSDYDKSLHLQKWMAQYWYVKRAQLGVYYIKTAICPETYRQCSLGICAPKAEECPITSLTLTPSPVNNASQAYGSSQYLTIYRALGEAPLINISISQNGPPCFDPNIIPNGPDEKYVTHYKVVENCGRYGFDNEHSTQVSQSNELQILEDNNVPESILRDSKASDAYKMTPSTLTARKRIIVNDKPICLNLDEQTIDKMTSILQNAKSSLEERFFFLLCLYYVFVILLAFLNCCVIRDTTFTMKSVAESLDFCLFIYKIFGALVVVFNFILIMNSNSYHSDLSRHRKYFESLLNQDCFPEGLPLRVVRDTYAETGDIFASYNSLAGIVIAITVVSVIATSSLRKCMHRKKLELVDYSFL